MLLTVEKVLLLSSVPLFSELPGETLADISSLFEEVEAPAGSTIIERGEHGDSMYVIVSGSVRIHEGETDIATLARGDIFGELAALAPEPRAADVSATQDSLLLRQDSDALYELITDSTDLARNIIRFLIHRYHSTPKGD